MPWTPRDAYSHTKKASTPELQKRWSSVANSALESGSDEASAIRQANASVSKSRPSKPRKTTTRRGNRYNGTS